MRWPSKREGHEKINRVGDLSSRLLQTKVKWLFMSHRSHRSQERGNSAAPSSCCLWVCGQDLMTEAWTHLIHPASASPNCKHLPKKPGEVKCKSGVSGHSLNSSRCFLNEYLLSALGLWGRSRCLGVSLFI